jgi:ATP-binding cassette subfamily B protein
MTDADTVEPRARNTLLVRLFVDNRRGFLQAGLAVVVSTLAMLTMPLAVKAGIDAAVRHDDFSPLGVALAVFLVAIAVDYTAQSIAQRTIAITAETAVRGLRMRLFRHVMSQPLAFFERMTSGRVIARLTSDLEALYELLGQASVAVIGNLLLLVGIAGVMLSLDWVLGLVVLAVVPLLVLATLLFRDRSEAAYGRVRERVGLVISSMSETITGVRVVQAFAREERTSEEFAEVNDSYREANQETVFLMSVYGPGVELIGQLAVVLVLIVGGYRALGTTHPEAYAGTLTAFVLYLRQFFDPLQELSQFYNSWQSGGAAAAQVQRVLDTASTVPQPSAPRTLPAGSGEVRLRDVTFGYGPDRTVLHDVDLVIPGGSTVALIGATGAGKSTIAKLVSRFYDPTAGSVTLDGVDLRELSHADLAEAVTVVTQEPFLFAGTIADNIRLGRPDATDADVAEAVAAVGADVVVATLPEGLQTDVSRRGARLSGGQRQLLAFARAWLAGPRVLVLDEATAALDVRTERTVQAALSRLLEGRTALVIAHRYSSLDLADRVVVVDAGRVVEEGPRAALLADPASRFAALHRAWEASLVGRTTDLRQTVET